MIECGNSTTYSDPETTEKKRKKRTVIVYFGALIQYLQIIGDKVCYIQIVAQAMLGVIVEVEHERGCPRRKGYTRHHCRTRHPKDFRGESYEVPIWQIRCLDCGAVFTILPSFLGRYQRWDIDAMAKLLQINLVMAGSYRYTYVIQSFGCDHHLPFNPVRILHLVHWLGSLIPLPRLLLRLGLTPPETVIEDEKFVTENGVETYVAFLAQQEVIWWIAYLDSTDELHLTETLEAFLAEVRRFFPAYNIPSATYDGWSASRAAFFAVNPHIILQECHLHARMRMSKALPMIIQEDGTVTQEQLAQIKEEHDSILDADSRRSYSQRLRRFRENFGHFTEVAKRCRSLKNKILMFLAFLIFPLVAKFTTVLDQIIKFFDRKFFIMQTFRVSESAKKTVRAFAIVRNFWRYMPGARRAGLSPVEIAGANLKGIPWLEFVNLASTSRMRPSEHVQALHDT
jgi:hypothetical protein